MKRRDASRMVALDAVLGRIAGGLLLITALLKIMSACSGVAYLGAADPVVSFLSNRSVLVVAGTIEMYFAWLLLLTPGNWYSRWGLLALCGTFSVYRVGLVALAARAPCPCPGRASDWLHLTPRQADQLALSVLLALSCAGAGLVALNWISETPQTGSPTSSNLEAT
jgi:hypothetical protein